MNLLILLRMFAMCLVALTGGACYAQLNFVPLTVHVENSNSVPIQAAKVDALYGGLWPGAPVGPRWTGSTDAHGDFHFVGGIQSPYKLEVTARGFKTSIQERIRPVSFRVFPVTMIADAPGSRRSDQDVEDNRQPQESQDNIQTEKHSSSIPDCAPSNFGRGNCRAPSVRAQAMPMKTFRDAKYGVSFRYPSEWTTGKMNMGDVGGELMLLPADLGPIIGISLEKTRLDGTFRYRAIPSTSATSCLDYLKSMVNEPAKLENAIIHGHWFAYGSNSVPATGQSFDAHLYETTTNGNCYLFEEDWDTHHRDIGPGEWEVAKKQAFADLERIMRTVQIARMARTERPPMSPISGGSE